MPVGMDDMTFQDNSFHIQNGFVIFIDVLGIKGIWMKKNPETVVKTWKEIIAKFTDPIDSTSNTPYNLYYCII